MSTLRVRYEPFNPPLANWKRAGTKLEYWV
jgi:hypothetical protein